MSVRTSFALSAATLSLLLAGCHHAKPRATAAPPLPVVSTEPVMVSVPPPTHRSEPLLAGDADGASIPVVKPVKPPKRVTKRQPAPAPVQPMPTQVAAAPTPTPAEALGQLTAGNENASASREQSAQALRTQRERVGGLSASVQSAHGAELEQARRFLKSGTDSWNAADYTGALALATKAKVLLDDVLK